jgi:hypothetical protein
LSIPLIGLTRATLLNSRVTLLRALSQTLIAPAVLPAAVRREPDQIPFAKKYVHGCDAVISLMSRCGGTTTSLRFSLPEMHHTVFDASPRPSLIAT